MPIGFNLPQVPFKLTGEEASGQPNYGDALRKGFQTAGMAMDLGAKPQTLASKLLEGKLANKQAQETLNNAPLQRSLLEAQIQKALRGPAPQMSNFEKAMQGYKRVVGQYGEGSPEASQFKQYLDKTAQGSNGVSIFNDPETGQSFVQVGGSSSKGKGGAGTFVNPQTGETRSLPGTAATNKLQQRIIGEEQLKPIFDQITENVPQFQSGWKDLQKSAEGLSNTWFGGEYQLPSDFAAGRAGLTKAGESLVNLFGLNANAHNLEKANSILQPIKGEASGPYKQRVLNEMTAFAKSKGISSNILEHGIQLSSGKTDETNSIKAPEIPSNIKNSKDFITWRKTLTPQQQSALKKQHIGG